jgi:hypothetical protein
MFSGDRNQESCRGSCFLCGSVAAEGAVSFVRRLFRCFGLRIGVWTLNPEPIRLSYWDWRDVPSGLRFLARLWLYAQERSKCRSSIFRQRRPGSDTFSRLLPCDRKHACLFRQCEDEILPKTLQMSATAYAVPGGGCGRCDAATSDHARHCNISNHHTSDTSKFPV